MSDLTKAKELLISGDYTCVLYKRNDYYTSTLRGVKPLVELLEGGKNFEDYSAADKVIGKATAFLYLLLGVKEIYAGVISRSALCLLKERNISVEYSTLANNIINRKGDGICPFEEAVLNTEDQDTAYSIILEKLKAL